MAKDGYAQMSVIGSGTSIGGSTAISTEELKVVLNSLKTQRETIQTTYNSMIKKVLESSSSCFSVSGLDYTEIISAFDTTFKNLDNHFDSLINLLENGVIQRYSELAMALRKMFGVDFASQLSQLMGLTKEINATTIRDIPN